MLIKIWNVRTEKEITLSELAQRCGISRAALSNYENEIRYPTIFQMEKLLKHWMSGSLICMNQIINEVSVHICGNRYG